MTGNIAVHYWVSGRVQGVWYRSSTEKIAKKLGLTGWVCNLSDGRVEILACGPKEKISLLQEWLWQGPTAAKVTEVISEEVPWQDHEDFLVK
jgi:acylphosphatase